MPLPGARPVLLGLCLLLFGLWLLLPAGTDGRLDRLAPEEAESWLTGINALRLVLGTRLDVREDVAPNLDPSHPRAQEWAIYLYLSWLQEQLVEAMADGR